MAILRAYALPHPVHAIPAIGRGEERNIVRTLAALDAVAQDIAMLRPDTIIFLTPHNVIYDNYFHISPKEAAKGNCGRFGAKHVRFLLNYEPNFTAVLSNTASKYGISAKTIGDEKAPLDHGVMVPLWFINRRYKTFKALRISPSRQDMAAHYRMGQALSDAATSIGRRVVVIASGNLSRKACEKEQSGYVQEAIEFDREMAHIFATGEFNRLLSISGSERTAANECGYNVFVIMAGCLDRRAVQAKLLSYENPSGEGYAVASFAPGYMATYRNFLEQSEQYLRAQVQKTRALEDAYCTLARRALEYSVLHNQPLPTPMGLPREMLLNRGGAFVSIYVNNQVRGAAGALGPTTDHIAAEIAKFAVIAGLKDKRYPPITTAELSGLTYRVDIIGKPEMVDSPDKLDPKFYGLIVTSTENSKHWSAILPNQHGIDTGEEQIAAVKQRAGIAPETIVKMERFEVFRHG